MKIYENNQEKDLDGARIAIEAGKGKLRVGYSNKTLIIAETNEAIPIGEKDKSSKGKAGLDVGKNCIEIHFKNKKSIQVFIDALKNLETRGEII